MILTDIHTHTCFSADAFVPTEKMIETAIKKGLKYYGLSEHLNYDYAVLGLNFCGDNPEIDLDEYFKKARDLQKQYKNDINLLVGLEFGFNDSDFCYKEYLKVQKDYKPDYVINAVHTCLGQECFFPEFTKDKSKEYAYGVYFNDVLKSLDVPYNYDVVAHIGYCSRNAVYSDPKIRYSDFAEIFDKILEKIIQKDKILEFNTSSRTAGSAFLPDVDVAQKYFDMGGRKVSFGSDAHDTDRIGDKYDLVVSALKNIGFTHFTVPNKDKIINITL